MSPSSRPFCISAVLRNTVLAVLRTIESASADRCPTALSISSSVARGLPRVRGFTASRRGEPANRRRTLARFLLWRDKRSRKSCVCNDAIEREKTGCQTNTPEYDCTCNRVDSLSQGNQAGNARDDQREQTHRYQHSEDDDYFPCAGIMGCGGFHDSLSLLCTWRGRLQSKRGKAADA